MAGSGPSGRYDVGLYPADLAAVQAALGAGMRIINQPITLTANTAFGRIAFESGGQIITGVYDATISDIVDTRASGIFDVSGGGSIVLEQSWARPEWWGVGGLRAAAAALSNRGGGSVILQAQTYAPEFTAAAPLENADGVTFMGSGAPDYNGGYTGLQGGTILQGPFCCLSHSVGFRDLGIDSGSTVCGDLYGGTAQDGLAIYNPSQLVGRTPWRNLRGSNLRILCKASDSPVHGLLAENVTAARFTDIDTMYGVCGVVLKGRGSTFKNIWARGHSVAPALAKSDVYAPCVGANLFHEIRMGPIVPGDTGPMRVQAATADLTGLSIRGLSGDGCQSVLTLEATGFAGADIALDDISGDGLAAMGVQIEGAYDRVAGANIRINNAGLSGATYGQGINIAAGAGVITLTNVQTANTASDGIRNAGDDTRVSNAACLNPGVGSAGFSGVGASTMILSNVSGTIASDSPGNIRGGGKIAFTPTAGGGITFVDGAGSHTLSGWYEEIERRVDWQMQINLTGGATSAAAGYAYFEGLPLGGESGTVTAAFLSATPAIPGAGFTNGIGAIVVPPWTASADSVVLAGTYFR